MCEAVGAAHDAGLFHRDIKPANVMVRPGDDVVVIDFGIARSPGWATLTDAGVAWGSVAWMAPECLEGKSSSEQSDVYALGCVLFQMLTGRVPFDGDTPIAVAYRHAHETVPAPSVISLEPVPSPR